ncbi:uncharacterized protein LOC129912748 [Episyrphus balteatus]|uniref:uncharacterized protein LOC129912748 n=1 Tax=Episyrphus balteatus TaxID=286459 RepID=UPI0024856B60|nr:uncharacterized protein LOC129912748 [Episyrphus balteatus]
MELHSYAKLRGYKKWTIQQKRKLVEARINYDGIFSRKSSNCMDSWKKIMTTAKLNDFNVCFVRKQWANLLAKYKAYKRTRLRQLGKNGEINDQIAREISEEWEFFYPIHSFMSKKPTNFHSYAQNPRDAADENGNDHDDELKPFPTIPPNTDHDFYSKSASREIPSLFKMESDELAIPNQATVATSPRRVSESVVVSGQNSENSIKIEEPEKIVQTEIIATDSAAVKKTKKKRKPSERDKYYKHKRRYDRRNERRMDALLNVVGQMVKEYFPNVDTSKLDGQSDQISTEDDNESDESETVFMEEDTESSCTAASSAEAPPSDESGL